MTTVANDSLERLFAEASVHHADPLWTVMEAMVPKEPVPKAVPTIWEWETMRPLLNRAGDLVGTDLAERRVFMLINPNLKAPFTTDTLYAGLQLIRPGEVARAHKHTAFALRFIVEGHGAFTAVGGEKVTMERGDLVLTPTFEFHDHGNESSEQMIWLDGLDLPLLHLMPVNFAQPYHDLQYPSTPAVGPSRLRYPWAEMQPRLDAAPGSFVELDYTHRTAGGPISATTGASALRIDAGATSGSIQETACGIYHVYEGSGSTVVGDRTLHWKQGDTFCIPMWMPYEHRGNEKSYLFRYHDKPLLDAMQWYATAR
jgi:gentisate 1,2-dioxygenase